MKLKNLEMYNKVFFESFNIEDQNKLNGFKYRDDNWDSVAHMMLISALEEVFDIMLDTEDVIDFSSYEKGKEILSAKYGIEF